MTTAVMNEPIRLLNLSYEVLDQNYSMHKAARLLSLGKAVIEEAHPIKRLGGWAYPKVIRLVYYIRLPYDKLNGPPRVSRRGILLRDNRTCGFCGQAGIATTIDHVTPRAQGGRNTWQNLIAACTPCNHKKGNRTPKEAGMPLLWKPYMPTRKQLDAARHGE